MPRAIHNASMTSPVSIIHVRPTETRIWEVDEGDGICCTFSTKQNAVDYATQRIAYQRGELRIFSDKGELERTIAFNE